MGTLSLRTPVTPPLHDNAWKRPTGNVEYRVTQPFGAINPAIGSTPHGGTDIGNGKLGGPIFAVAAGTVIYASDVPRVPWNYPSPPDKLAVWGPSYGGRTIVIDHGAGVFSLYAHCASMLVHVGDSVPSGRQIATIGQTGSAAGQGHLHFGLRVAERWIDAEPYIRLGQPLTIEDDMLYFSGGTSKVLINRDTAIRAGTNVRSRPDLSPDSVLFTTPTDRQLSTQVTMQVEGAESNGSKVWYWLPIYVDGKGFTMAFVHSSRVTPLQPAESTGLTADQRAKLEQAQTLLGGIIA